MKHILIPIDFSKTSTNAFEYALNMSQDIPSTLLVLNVFMPTSVDYTGMYINDDILINQRSERLDMFVEHVESQQADHAHKATLKKSFKIGFPKDQILQTAKEDGSDIILMGTKGDNDWMRNIFGSVSTGVMKDAKVPVMIIPNDIKYTGLKNILVAIDSMDHLPAEIQAISNLVDINTTHLHIAHVTKKSDPIDTIEIDSSIFDKYPLVQVSETHIVSDDVVNGINKYANEQPIDLIVLSTHRRNILQQFTHRSVTTELVHVAHVPMLITKD